MYAEIVAKDRDRPIGAILLDICLDLGIVPDLMDPATWDELRQAITLYGGDPARLLADGMDSANPAGSADVTGVTGVGRKSEAHSATGTSSPDFNPIPTAAPPIIVYPPWPGPSAQSPPPASTGPP
jgi:hypothetical protein